MTPDYTNGLQLARSRLLQAFKDIDTELQRTHALRLGDVEISTSQMKSSLSGCTDTVVLNLRLDLHASDEKSSGQFSGK